MEVPEIEQFRAYRPVTGSHEVVATYEFSDLNSFSTWIVKEETQQMAEEARAYCEDMTCELWGPSPVASKIIHSA
jgi:hypothetical protein